MPRLIACVACGQHLKVHEDACPHCGATQPATVALSRAGVAFLGLALSGCLWPDAEAAYGVPTTGETTGAPTVTSADGSDGDTGTGSGSADATGSSTTGSDTTGSDTTGSDTTEGSGSDTAADTTGDAGTGSSTDGTTGAESTGTDDGESGVEPPYGVPETASG